MSARADILARCPRHTIDLPRRPRTAARAPHPEAAERLAMRLEQNGGHSQFFSDFEAAGDWLKRRATTVLCPTPDLAAALGLPVEPVTSCDAVDSIVVPCSGAIAPTGTLVISSRHTGPVGRAFLPNTVYLALSHSDIYMRTEDCLRPLIREAPSSLHLISGTSCTGDLGLMFLRLAHGPEHLFVLIVNRPQPGADR